MLGIQAFPIGDAYFQVLLLLVSGRVNGNSGPQNPVLDSPGGVERVDFVMSRDWLLTYGMGILFLTWISWKDFS